MSQSPQKSRRFWLIPLVFFLLAGVMGVALFKGDASLIPSALIDAPAPEFDLAPVPGLEVAGLKTQDLITGEPVILNIWASWCAPCRLEHPVLMDMAQNLGVPLFGLNYKDEAPNAARFLKDLGNPYARIGHDLSGRVGIDWGLYGVPETFIIDGKGIIRYKHVGPLTPQLVETVIKPELAKARLPLSN